MLIFASFKAGSVRGGGFLKPAYRGWDPLMLQTYHRSVPVAGTDGVFQLQLGKSLSFFAAFLGGTLMLLLAIVANYNNDWPMTRHNHKDQRERYKCYETGNVSSQ